MVSGLTLIPNFEARAGLNLASIPGRTEDVEGNLASIPRRWRCARSSIIMNLIKLTSALLFYDKQKIVQNKE